MKNNFTVLTVTVVRRELSVKVKTDPLEVFQCTRTGLHCWGNTRHSPVYGMKLRKKTLKTALTF